MEKQIFIFPLLGIYVLPMSIWLSVCRPIPLLMSAQYLKFAYSSTFQIYSQGHDYWRNAKFDFRLDHFFFSRVMSICFRWKWGTHVHNILPNLFCRNWHYIKSNCICHELQGDFFFSYLADFSTFSKKNLKVVVGHCQNRLKMTLLKEGVDGFSYFIF